METKTQSRSANARRRLAIAATLLTLATAGCTEEALAFFGGHDVKPPAAAEFGLGPRASALNLQEHFWKTNYVEPLGEPRRW